MDQTTRAPGGDTIGPLPNFPRGPQACAIGTLPRCTPAVNT